MNTEFKNCGQSPVRVSAVTDRQTELTSAIHLTYDIYLSSVDIEEDLMHLVDALCGSFMEELPHDTAENFPAN